MRLLHTTAWHFEEFFDDWTVPSKVPEYAILSHRWGKDEITHQELLQLAAYEASTEPSTLTLMSAALEQKRRGAGFRKIVNARTQAASDNLEWIWVDTCCIDKTSSAELSEAINSMWNWYEGSEVCYAYLRDVRPGHVIDDLYESQWFTRGWTLQELLAPDKVGDKVELLEDLKDMTGIKEECLQDGSLIAEETVATIMSWAGERHTTRIEDQAYCLMGLFRVNISLLYGEGPRAFQRLQREIIAQSDDESIFAHRHNSHWTPLAAEPGDFYPSVKPSTLSGELGAWFQFLGLGRYPFTVTNKGIEIRPAWIDECQASALDCCLTGTTQPAAVACRIQWLSSVADPEFGQSWREAGRQVVGANQAELPELGCGVYVPYNIPSLTSS